MNALTHLELRRSTRAPVLNAPNIEFQEGAEPTLLLGRDDWTSNQLQDSYIVNLRVGLINKSSPQNSFYTIHQDLVCYFPALATTPRIVVPSSLWRVVYTIAHDKLGHRGLKPTLSHICCLLYTSDAADE